MGSAWVSTGVPGKAAQLCCGGGDGDLYPFPFLGPEEANRAVFARGCSSPLGRNKAKDGARCWVLGVGVLPSPQHLEPSPQPTGETMITRFDHAVIAVRDLDQALRLYRDVLGLDAHPGGRHTGLGTHNGIVRLGLDYLELLAVADRAEEEASGPTSAALVDYLTRREG